MKMRKTAAWAVLALAAGGVSYQSAPKAQATPQPLSQMIWVPTNNWLGCDDGGPTPECADYGTPTGSIVQMTCCVSQDALFTGDAFACGEDGIGRERTEL